MTATQKHIVFDWNSTLLDDLGALHDCTNLLLQGAGHAPVTLEFFQAHYDIPFQTLYRNLGLADHQVDHLIDANNRIFHDHYEPLADQADLRFGARDLLHTAHHHGVRNYILSNHLVDPIRTQLRRLEIEHFFADVLAYADREAQRQRAMTKGESLRHFMTQQGIAGQPAMIVGDSVEEIEIARDQGMISVAITGGCVSEQRLRAANPDYVIHNLHELRPIMAQRGFVA